MEITPEVFAQVIKTLKAAEAEAIMLQSRLSEPYRKHQVAVARLCRETLDALGEQR